MRFNWCLIAALVLMVGCHTPRKGETVSKDLSGSDPDAQVNFWHSLTDKPVTSNDQAFHALLPYVDTKDERADYPARFAALKSKKMLSAGWYEAADGAVKRGTVAVALMQVIQNRGGVTMHIVGPQ